MLLPPFQDALVLTGPTGAGKTELALALARRLDAEIISMDSMALYRGMDIGTAKPTATERAIVPHHLVDVLDPWQASSVAWWLEEARRAAADIEARGKTVLFVGGTPLYLKALIFGLFEGPEANRVIRERLEAQVQTVGAAALHAHLAQVDAVSAARIHPNDARRIIRALEVHELTGRPMSEWQVQWRALESGPSPRAAIHGQIESAPKSAENRPASVLWLDSPRSLLYERIDRRVVQMFEQGLVEEVRRLKEDARGLSREARQALGYKEVLAHLEGERGREETIAQVQLRTRHFAKRQITWFRHLPDCRLATSELTWTLWHPRMHNG